ncbi:MAG: recombinase family protein, partial [Nitrosospira sp.]
MKKKMTSPNEQRSPSMKALTHKTAKGANQMDKAVIYCRVSTKRQSKEGDGLASQATRCREFARYRNLEVIEVFQDSESGS